MRYALAYTEDNLHSDLGKIIAMRDAGKIDAFKALEMVQKAISHWQKNN